LKNKDEILVCKREILVRFFFIFSFLISNSFFSQLFISDSAKFINADSSRISLKKVNRSGKIYIADGAVIRNIEQLHGAEIVYTTKKKIFKEKVKKTSSLSEIKNNPQIKKSIQKSNTKNNTVHHSYERQKSRHLFLKGDAGSVFMIHSQDISFAGILKEITYLILCLLFITAIIFKYQSYRNTLTGAKHKIRPPPFFISKI